ncbi:hypothetical protein BSZ07_00505 [Streptomyces sp. M1013]|nr:hypothetical protein BSZ07_00505 [Streptomyces sp. M1013]
MRPGVGEATRLRASHRLSRLRAAVAGPSQGVGKEVLSEGVVVALVAADLITGARKTEVTTYLRNQSVTGMAPDWDQVTG